MNLNDLRKTDYIDPLYQQYQKYNYKSSSTCPVTEVPRREVYPKNHKFYQDEVHKYDNFNFSFRRLSKYSPCPEGFVAGSDGMCFSTVQKKGTFYEEKSSDFFPTVKNNKLSDEPLKSNNSVSRYNKPFKNDLFIEKRE